MLISIICPVYNSSRHITDAVLSVVNQTNGNWELILVDDGSTDDSGVICDEFASKDSRIKVIHKENQGQMKARIDGIKNSSGEYVAFLDSDDVLNKEMVEDLLSKIHDSNNIDLLVFNAETFPKNELNKTLPLVEKNTVIHGNFDILENLFGTEMFGYLWMYCFKKELLNTDICSDNLFLDIRYTEDAAFIYKIIRNVNCLCLMSSCLYSYRENATSITHTLNNKDRRDRFLVFNYIYSDIYGVYRQFSLSNNLSLMISWSMFSYLEHLEDIKTFKKAFEEVKKSFIFNKICRKTKKGSKRFVFYRFLLRLNLSSLLYKYSRGHN